MENKSQLMSLTPMFQYQWLNTNNGVSIINPFLPITKPKNFPPISIKTKDQIPSVTTRTTHFIQTIRKFQPNTNFKRNNHCFFPLPHRRVATRVHGIRIGDQTHSSKKGEKSKRKNSDEQASIFIEKDKANRTIEINGERERERIGLEKVKINQKKVREKSYHGEVGLEKEVSYLGKSEKKKKKEMGKLTKFQPTLLPIQAGPPSYLSPLNFKSLNPIPKGPPSHLFSPFHSPNVTTLNPILTGPNHTPISNSLSFSHKIHLPSPSGPSNSHGPNSHPSPNISYSSHFGLFIGPTHNPSTNTPSSPKHTIPSSSWIFDCGATDTMSFDSQDFLTLGPASRTHIQTANGACVSVDHAGPIKISSSIHLNNCLLIPSLTHKLLSISQLTKELNCTVTMSSTGCVVRDVQTGRIIGRGTERGGLYYVDEAAQKGHTLLAHGSPDHQMRMWHRRLGHPSLGHALISHSLDEIKFEWHQTIVRGKVVTKKILQECKV